jgi:glycerol uptake facilitator protein
MLNNPFFGEFMGTMVLVLLGNGVVANVLLHKSKAQGAGWVAITMGFALAVMAGIFTAVACGSSDAHINPAVTLGFAIASGNYAKLAPYALAQLLGAMAGALLVWLHFLPHWRATPEHDLKLACFSTGPAIPSRFSNLFSETLGTCVLVWLIAAIFSSKNSSNGPAPGLGPYLVGAVVWAIGLSLGGTTGFAINPARDLGPRILHALLPIPGKGESGWGYAWIPVVGGLAGGALAASLIRLTSTH